MNASVIFSLMVGLAMTASVVAGESVEKDTVDKRGPPTRFHINRAPPHHLPQRHFRPSGPRSPPQRQGRPSGPRPSSTASRPVNGGNSIVMVEDGESQSPVNIIPRDTITKCMPSLFLLNYGAEREGITLANHGTEVEITFPATEKVPSISGGPLPAGEAYILDSIHFHWGEESSKGSEHQISNKTYPMEMHMVHYNSKYGSKSEALDDPKGLAVMGVLFRITPNGNEKYRPLTDSFTTITEYGGSVVLEELFKLDALLPTSKNSYYTYEGSLTTSPYSESVTWIVWKNFVGISENQMAQFRSLLKKDGTAISGNFRELQALGNREIIQAQQC